MEFTLIPKNCGLENVNGFYFDGVNAGFKKDEPDVGFIYSQKPSLVSAVFTKNKFQASPIKHFKSYGENFKTNFILLNSKNANAMTGEQGVKDIEEILNSIPLKLNNPLMSSTGVIGYRLDKSKFLKVVKEFDFTKRDSDKVSRAIMTTDSFKKELALEVTLKDGSIFNIAAIAKGAGMINPSLATMLCFVLTDAKIPKEDMDELLKIAVENSFNKISVDGDTSTNDTVMLLSSDKNPYNKEAFKEAINFILFELSQMILRDGEGSNKVVAFTVNGAKTTKDAKKASHALSNSLLVKTALFGEDPNWGRIASTIGASGIECDEEKLEIFYDNLLIYGKNQKELDKETEEKAYKIMKQDSFKITCNLGLGSESYTSYGCDLSYEYVKINAEYRT